MPINPFIFIIALFLVIDGLLLIFVFVYFKDISAWQSHACIWLYNEIQKHKANLADQERQVNNYNDLIEVETFKVPIGNARKYVVQLEEQLQGTEQEIQKIRIPKQHSDSLIGVWELQKNAVLLCYNSVRLWQLRYRGLTSIEADFTTLRISLDKLRDGHKVLYARVTKLQERLGKLQKTISVEQEQGIYIDDWQQTLSDLLARAEIDISRVDGPVSPRVLRQVSEAYIEARKRTNSLEQEVKDWVSASTFFKNKLKQLMADFAYSVSTSFEPIDEYRPLIDQIEICFEAAKKHREKRILKDLEVASEHCAALLQLLEVLQNATPLARHINNLAVTEGLKDAIEQNAQYKAVIERTNSALSQQEADELIVVVRRLNKQMQQTSEQHVSIKAQLSSQAEKLREQLMQAVAVITKIAILTDEKDIDTAINCTSSFDAEKMPSKELRQWMREAKEVHKKLQTVKEDLSEITDTVSDALMMISQDIQLARKMVSSWAVLQDRVTAIQAQQQEAQKKHELLQRSVTLQDLRLRVAFITRQQGLIKEHFTTLEKEYQNLEEEFRRLEQNIKLLEEQPWKADARQYAEALIESFRYDLARLRLEPHMTALERKRQDLKDKVENVIKGMLINKEAPMQSINIGGNSTIMGSVVIAQTIQDSFNTINGAAAPQTLKDHLTDLAKAVTEMSNKLPADQQKEVARALQILTEESVKHQPQRRWWEVSAEGLAEAAKKVGDIGVPVIKLLDALRPLLEKSFV